MRARSWVLFFVLGAARTAAASAHHREFLGLDIELPVSVAIATFGVELPPGDPRTEVAFEHPAVTTGALPTTCTGRMAQRGGIAADPRSPAQVAAVDPRWFLAERHDGRRVELTYCSDWGALYLVVRIRMAATTLIATQIDRVVAILAAVDVAQFAYYQRGLAPPTMRGVPRPTARVVVRRFAPPFRDSTCDDTGVCLAMDARLTAAGFAPDTGYRVLDRLTATAKHAGQRRWQAPRKSSRTYYAGVGLLLDLAFGAAGAGELHPPLPYGDSMNDANGVLVLEQIMAAAIRAAP